MIKTILEVYVTNEEEFTPYTSPLNSNPLTEEPENSDGFTLHEGEITETITYPALDEANMDKDYKDISGSASCKLEYRNIDLKYIYKGVRCKLITTIDNEEPITYLGFITNVSYDQDGISLDIASFEKLLEVEGQCVYTQQLRSVILGEVIKEAGMVPVIDVTGLNDEVINYTSKSSSDDEDDDSSGEAKYGDDCQATYSLCVSHGRSHGNCGNGEDWDSEAENGIANKDAAYHDWARGCSSNEEMLLALRDYMHYSLYPDNQYNCASDTFDGVNDFWANCGDSARLVKACCDSRGLPCVCIHGSPYGCGHYWNVIKWNGSWETFDLCYPSTSYGDSGGTNTSNIWH